MAYQALYRKWRPSNFDEVRGQDHIVTTLGGDRLQDQRGRCGGGRQEGTVHRTHRRRQDFCLQRDPRGQDPHRRRGLCRPAGCGVKLQNL